MDTALTENESKIIDEWYEQASVHPLDPDVTVPSVREFAERVCEYVFARFMDRTPMQDWEQRELLDLYMDAECILALDK